MNVFVAFFVLLLLLADSTPPAASTIPLIGEFFSVLLSGFYSSPFYCCLFCLCSVYSACGSCFVAAFLANKD